MQIYQTYFPDGNVLNTSSTYYNIRTKNIFLNLTPVKI